ncbi:MAG: hypothetical protein J6A89_02555 [Clostridia bacterium]|nr:hypothetical protein [Clostridia bacterium]
MNFFISLIGALLGILLAIGITIFIIYCKIKSAVGATNMKALTNAISNASDYEKEEYSREKNVRGMTKLLEEEILRDFPEFNKDLIFSMCESNLIKILNSLESRNSTKINKDPNLIHLKKKISEQIEDMKSNNITEKYDNIEFYRHAISAYTKKNGKATIQLSTTLSYYYTTNRKDKKSFSNIKKQTRYTSEFIYVYDEAKFNDNQASFSVHCPNCGAPLRNIKTNYCEYCSTYIENINLKAWKMSSYKEDYKY